MITAGLEAVGGVNLSVSDLIRIVKFLSHKYTNRLDFATIVVLSIMRGGSSYRLRLLVYCSV